MEEPDASRSEEFLRLVDNIKIAFLIPRGGDNPFFFNFSGDFFCFGGIHVHRFLYNIGSPAAMTARSGAPWANGGIEI